MSGINAPENYADRKKQVNPKHILLDLKMPRVWGVQVLEKLKSDPAFSSIPVVMLTPYNAGPDIDKCYALGANSYIVNWIVLVNTNSIHLFSKITAAMPVYSVANWKSRD